MSETKVDAKNGHRSDDDNLAALSNGIYADGRSASRVDGYGDVCAVPAASRFELAMVQAAGKGEIYRPTHAANHCGFSHPLFDARPDG